MSIKQTIHLSPVYKKKRKPLEKIISSFQAVRIGRRLPTLPPLGSTIGVDGLNFSVRNGKRWNPGAIATINKIDISIHVSFRNLTHLLLTFNCSVSFQPMTFLLYALSIQSFGQLVVLGCDIAACTPAPYQRRSLQRPSKEI